MEPDPFGPGLQWAPQNQRQKRFQSQQVGWDDNKHVVQGSRNNKINYPNLSKKSGGIIVVISGD